MDPLALTLIELGAVVFCLGMLARLAGRIGMSPIPLYLLGGLFFGAGGVIKLEGMHEFAHLSSEIGVILLLLMLGLEYTAAELVTGLRRSWQAGVLDLVLNFLPGAILAVLLGWGVVGAMVMGGVTYISSSGIAAKVITDLGRIGNRETPVVLSILVFEDLAMAIYLPVLTATLAGVSFAVGLQTVGISLAVVTVVLLVALRHGHHVSKAVHSENSEVFLLNLLGAALLVAGLAAAMQVSAAVGAFMLGIAISGATAHNATRILEPLRDLFAAIFFVVFGLNTDPSTIPPVLGWALLLAIATAITKMLTGIWAAKRAGIGVPGRFRAGAALIARGEFSIVIAGLAVASGVVPAELAAMAIYLPILTATLAGVSFVVGLQTVGISLAVVTVVLLVALRHGHHVSKAVHSENSEVFLLNLLGAALLVAGLAAAM
ncbi:MAG TPA: cation:proton antiporter, partial [Arthrobacter sp.]